MSKHALFILNYIYRSEEQDTFPDSFYWPVIMVINLSPCLSHSSSSALSSMVASSLSPLPSCFLSVSPSLNPLYYSHVSAFNPPEPGPIPAMPFPALCFVFSHSHRPSLHPSVSPSASLLLSVSRRLLCKASSTPTEARHPSPCAPIPPRWFIKALLVWTHTRR